MSFLAPLFLAGAAAVALPFIFHLIRRSSSDKVMFSSLMFLEPSPPRVAKRSRLEHLFLLLLRCAVLCLLALAFARPFLPRKMAAAPAADQSARVAILVDASASMRRENLWDEARNRAVEAVRELEPTDLVAVYTFDQTLGSVLNFTESAAIPSGERAAATKARLAAIEPSYGGTHLGNALVDGTEQLLEQINRDAREQGNTALRLVVISDFQSGAKLDGLQGYEWPAKMHVQLETVSAEENSNAGLQMLQDPERVFLAATNIIRRVRVNNSPESKIEQFTLQWEAETAGGIRPAGAETNSKVYVPAGQSRIVPSPARPEGATALVLAGDNILFDNRTHVPELKAAPVTVAYYGAEAANDPRAMRYYVHRAFEQTNLTTQVIGFSNSIPAEASSASMLILAGNPSSEALDLARTILAGGRGVLLPMSGPGQASAVQALLDGKLVTAREAEVENHGLFGRIDFQHPLFAPFSDARFSDFTKIHFWKHRVLDLSNVTNATVVAAFDSGTPALAEIPVGEGRLWVLASTWAPSDSQFALSSKFVPLMFGMLEQSANVRSGPRQYTVGETVVLPVDTREVRLPDGTVKPTASERFSETLTPGIYQAGEIEFAVNIDPAESRLNPLEPEELLSLGVPIGQGADAATQVRTAERERVLLATDTEARQKLWRNFVLAALAFVLLETWIAGRLSRVPTPAGA